VKIDIEGAFQPLDHGERILSALPMGVEREEVPNLCVKIGHGLAMGLR
jgi:hypothetical protein